MLKAPAWIAYALSTLLLVFVCLRSPAPDERPTSSPTTISLAAASVLLTLPAIALSRSRVRGKHVLIILLGLQAMICLNGLVAALGGYF